MPDIVDPQTRSRMMAGIRGKNTRPELTIRRELFRRGFRYRIHPRNLPGKPDMVFPARRAVIFVHGCFWHGHHCHLFKWPSTRMDFWRQKISRNRRKDAETLSALEKSGWRCLTIWECALKGRTRRSLAEIADNASVWLSAGETNLELEGVN
jgi:DNA mismatch endonuclease (patch repair protein)